MRYLLVIALLVLVCCSGAEEPVVKIYQTSIKHEFLDDARKLKNVNYPETPMEDYISGHLWGYLTCEVYREEAKVRNIVPDPAYVQKRIIEGSKTTITDEQYEVMKKAESALYELLMEFRESEEDIEVFAAEVWKQRGPELRQLDVAQDQESLRSYLLLLDADKNHIMIGSKPDSLPESREEFLRQVNDSSQNVTFYEHMSQIEQVKQAVVGKLGLSSEEIHRGKAYFEKNKTSFAMHDAFQSGGLDALLLELKRENLLDCWIMEKVEQDAIFHDSAVEQAFFRWQTNTLPRHREVFGPFGEEKAGGKPDE